MIETRAGMKPLDDEPLDLPVAGFWVLPAEPQANHLFSRLVQIEGHLEAGANEAVADRFHERNSIAF